MSSMIVKVKRIDPYEFEDSATAIMIAVTSMGAIEMIKRKGSHMTYINYEKL